ncbi:hypothetical protein D3C72_867640 [compost metagenome]
MELGGKDVAADTDHLVLVQVRTRQHGRAGRRLQHGLGMQHLRGEGAGQAGQQLVAGGRGQQFDGLRADFAARRVVAHLAAQRIRQQLVAVAHAEHGQFSGGGLAQPGGGVFAPGFLVRDHGGRTRDQRGAVVGGGLGPLALVYGDDFDGVGGQSGRFFQLFGIAAELAFKHVFRIAGVQDQDGQGRGYCSGHG